MQQHETLSSIHITSFHTTAISIIQLYHLSTLLKYQLTHYVYRRSYQVEHFFIKVFIIERLHADYSSMIIPIPTKENYKIQLISKVEKNTLKFIAVSRKT